VGSRRARGHRQDECPCVPVVQARTGGCTGTVTRLRIACIASPIASMSHGVARSRPKRRAQPQRCLPVVKDSRSSSGAMPASCAPASQAMFRRSGRKPLPMKTSHKSPCRTVHVAIAQRELAFGADGHPQRRHAGVARRRLARRRLVHLGLHHQRRSVQQPACVGRQHGSTPRTSPTAASAPSITQPATFLQSRRATCSRARAPRSSRSVRPLQRIGRSALSTRSCSVTSPVAARLVACSAT